MCFSASASFTASAVLLLCSIATLSRAKKNQYMLAMTPLLFSIQQFFEGMVWLGTTSGNNPTLAAYGFLFFIISYPIWIPLSIRQMSSTQSEKNATNPSLIAGILLAIVVIGYYGMATPIIQVLNNHISYTVGVPTSFWIPATILYLFATILPFFVIKNRNLWILGTLLALSYAVSFFFYYQTILSIWCFFVAIISITILFVLG